MWTVLLHTPHKYTAGISQTRYGSVEFQSVQNRPAAEEQEPFTSGCLVHASTKVWILEQYLQKKGQNSSQVTPKSTSPSNNKFA